MTIEDCIRGNNPSRGETYVFTCGQSFIDDLEEIRKYGENKGILT